MNKVSDTGVNIETPKEEEKKYKLVYKTRFEPMQMRNIGYWEKVLIEPKK